jgi:ubiquinone/menaquinone biosynthesis C-methylase UbiE
MKPTERFSSRVADYVRYRPTYPDAVFELLERECGLGAGAQVADVGSGTGIFSKLLADRGAEVFGVEPNADMLAAADEFMRDNPRFHSITGTAEQTHLEDQSVDLITCAQAFHWFDQARALPEFKRILRPRGILFLVWNERKDSGEFLAGYEDALRTYCPEYLKVDHRNTQGQNLGRFFKSMKRATFPLDQSFDEAGFLGRAASSSYVPREGQPGHEAFFAELRRLFVQHQRGGRVTFEHDTECYYGEPR